MDQRGLSSELDLRRNETTDGGPYNKFVALRVLAATQCARCHPTHMAGQQRGRKGQEVRSLCRIEKGKDKLPPAAECISQQSYFWAEKPVWR